MGGKKREKLDMEDDRRTEAFNPMKKRSCTDILCLLLFLVFLGGWAGVAYVGISQGNPMLLVYPSDSQGRICGTGDLVDRPSLLFFDLTQCIKSAALAGCATPQVCVEKCPTETSSMYACYQSGFGNICPGLFDPIKYRVYCVNMTDEEWEEGLSDPRAKLIHTKKCPPYVLQSKPIIGRCVPDFGILDDVTSGNTSINMTYGPPVLTGNGSPVSADNVFTAIEYLTELLNLRGMAEKVWGDLVSSWQWILAGQGVALVVGFLWIFLMRFLAGLMIWLSLIGGLGLVGLSAVYSWLKYEGMKSVESAAGSIFETNPITDDLSSYLALRDTWLAFFIISIVIFCILLIIIIFLRTRIKIATELIGEASKAVGSILSSLFFPIFPFLLQLAVVSVFGVVAAYLASAGEQQFSVVDGCDSVENMEDGDTCVAETFSNATCATAQCVFHKFGPNTTINYLQLYNLFGLFWGLFLVSALGEMVLAGTFASWYWALDKSRDVPSLPVLASLYRTFRYHLGTLAFGSLIIAIIRMIRVMLEYLESKLKEKGLDNPVVKAILCLCKCCFWCLEAFMKFLNRNAYIITASYGTNFCRSAKEAFSLILRNCARVAVLDKVTDFLLFMGKLVVTGTVALLSYLVFSGSLDGQMPLELDTPPLNYYFVPVVLITISAYCISCCFFSVYSMAVDTLFLCFLLDIEQNDGKDDPQYYMSKNLMNILDLKNKKKSDKKY